MKEKKEDENGRGAFFEPKEVLIFRSTGVYVGSMCSVRAIAEHSQLPPQCISRVCLGERIVTQRHYYRYSHPNVEIEKGDYNTLTVMEYDKLCKFKGSYLAPQERKATKRKLKNEQNDE